MSKKKKKSPKHNSQIQREAKTQQRREFNAALKRVLNAIGLPEVFDLIPDNEKIILSKSGINNIRVVAYDGYKISSFLLKIIKLLIKEKFSNNKLELLPNKKLVTVMDVIMCCDSIRKYVKHLDDDQYPNALIVKNKLDFFVEKWISQWPDSLTVETGPGDPIWRAKWLAKHRHFDAGHWPPSEQ